jgi:hypothetical protein
MFIFNVEQTLSREAEMMTNGRMVREGIWVGFVGATAVALWFLLVDTLAGQPLQTPAALGGALFRLPAESAGTALAAYTGFHYVAFGAVGVLAAYSTRLAERHPHVLALFLLLFAVFQAAFYGMVAVLDMTMVLGKLTWVQIAAGNLVATTAMGGLLWRRHPAVRRALAVALAN